MAVDPLSLGLTGIGFLGSLFGSESSEEMTGEQRATYDALLKRSKGIDPKLLALMRARMKGAVGQEHAGLSASTASRLRRQGAPISIQEQHLDKLRQRRFGAQSDALLGVDQMNEGVKGQALGQLAGFTGRFAPNRNDATGQGFSQLFGAGIQGLMRNYGNVDDTYMQMQRVNETVDPSYQVQTPRRPRVRGMFND